MTPVMSETEARGKWCPFVRVRIETFPPIGTSINRAESGSPCHGSLCISSVCMAWRTARIALSGEVYGCCGLAGGAP